MVGKNVQLSIMSLLNNDTSVFSDRRLAAQFTKVHLIPAVENVIAQGNILTVNLNGFNRYTRSWLYEMVLTFKQHQLLYALQTSVEFVHELSSYALLIKNIIAEIMLQTVPDKSDVVKYADNVAYVEFFKGNDEGALRFGMGNYLCLHITYSVLFNVNTHKKPITLMVLPSGELVYAHLVTFKEKMCTERIELDLNTVQLRYAVIVRTLFEKQGVQDNLELPHVLYTSDKLQVKQIAPDVFVIHCGKIDDDIITVDCSKVLFSENFKKITKGSLPKKVKVSGAFISKQKIIKG